MALETATMIHQLDPANPAGPDRLASGDDHIRMIKAALKGTFPNINAPITVTDEDLNTLSGLGTPRGVISLWFGSAAAIPVGYALCDGSAAPRSDGAGTIQTPDMRGRVPVGVDATNALGATFGGNSKAVTSAGGGAHNHVGATEAGSGAHTHAVTIAETVLTVAQIPSHSHNLGLSSLNQIGHDSSIEGDRTVTTSGFGGGYIEPAGGGTGHTHAGTLDGAGSAHSHNLTIDAVPAHSHSVTVDVVQASLALHYIMKV